jgi:hypothetical protein
MAQQGTAGERVEHLGQIGAHPLAHPRSQHYYV